MPNSESSASPIRDGDLWSLIHGAFSELVLDIELCFISDRRNATLEERRNLRISIHDSIGEMIDLLETRPFAEVLEIYESQISCDSVDSHSIVKDVFTDFESPFKVCRAVVGLLQLLLDGWSIREQACKEKLCRASRIAILLRSHDLLEQLQQNVGLLLAEISNCGAEAQREINLRKSVEIKEAASALGVGERTVNNRIAKGDLVAIFVDETARVTRLSLQIMLNNTERKRKNKATTKKT